MINSDNMDKPKFVLPSPIFEKNAPPKSQPHYLTPSGMTLLTRDRQPPPMYGPKGSTIPPQHMKQNVEEKLPDEPPKPKPYCEACEMELHSADDMRRHRAQHERCPVDGCKFKGHPNVMDKHVTTLHSSGLFEKIKKISTPEEIAAWREERRKKFPTLANAKMRQLAQEQRERRGERLEGNKARFGRQEDRKRARANTNRTESQRMDQPKRMRNNEGAQKKSYENRKEFINNRKTAAEKVQEKQAVILNMPSTGKIVEVTDELVVCGIKMFRGTSELQDYQHEKKKAGKAKNALVSLVGMYGSDDDDDEDFDSASETNISQNADGSAQSSQKTLELSKSDVPTTNGPQILNKQTTENDDLNQIKENITQGDINNHVLLENVTKNPTEAQTVLMISDSEVESSNCDQKEINQADIENNTSTRQGLPQASLGSVYETNAPTLTEHHVKETASPAVIEEVQPANLNESSDEAPEEAPIQRTTTMPELPSTSNNSQGESIESKRLRIEQSRKALQNRQARTLTLRKRILRKQNTMLEKLLEPEIRHERNVLLQCVRFVCENNFFGIGEAANKKTQLNPEASS